MGRFEVLGEALDLLFGKILNRNFNKADELIQKTEQKIDDLKQEVDTIVAHAGDGTKDTEIILARGNAPTLGGRLDASDAKLAEKANAAVVTANITALEQNKADTSYVDDRFNQLGKLQVNGVFPTLTDLQTAYPTGAQGVYVVQSDGKWYYWSNGWLSGGLYQSAGIADQSIETRHLRYLYADGQLVEVTINVTYEDDHFVFIISSDMGSVVDKINRKTYSVTSQKINVIDTREPMYVLYNTESSEIEVVKRGTLTTPERYLFLTEYYFDGGYIQTQRDGVLLVDGRRNGYQTKGLEIFKSHPNISNNGFSWIHYDAPDINGNFSESDVLEKLTFMKIGTTTHTITNGVFESKETVDTDGSIVVFKHRLFPHETIRYRVRFRISRLNVVGTSFKILTLTKNAFIGDNIQVNAQIALDVHIEDYGSGAKLYCKDSNLAFIPFRDSENNAISDLNYYIIELESRNDKSYRYILYDGNNNYLCASEWWHWDSLWPHGGLGYQVMIGDPFNNYYNIDFELTGVEVITL